MGRLEQPAVERLRAVFVSVLCLSITTVDAVGGLRRIGLLSENLIARAETEQRVAFLQKVCLRHGVVLTLYAEF